MLAKAYSVTVTFQVTEQIAVEAVSPDEALRLAIETMGDALKDGQFVHADAAPQATTA